MEVSEPTLQKNWCRTQPKIVKFDFTWTIEKFSFPNDEEQPKWCLKLYPKGEDEEFKDYVALFLHLDEHNQATESISAKFKFCILKVNGEPSNVVGPEKEADKFVQGKGWGYSNFIRRDFFMDPQNDLLPNDQLSIFCEISMVVHKVNVSSQSGCSVPQIRLFDDMGAMLEKGLFADFVLCSDGKEFNVHKGVLACRSPVFAAMFEHAMQEKHTNKVNIPDISAPVLGQLLHFLYTGCEPKLLAEQDMAEELLVAADKYQLDRLKAICERQLCASLDKENVCKMLALADLHEAGHLRVCAIEYINLHSDEVTQSEGWPAFVSSHPELLKQLVKGLTQFGTDTFLWKYPPILGLSAKQRQQS